jgi:threonine/homoserine/homoserine lactone efflux protein
MHSDLIGFVGVAAVVTIAPAADFALVSRRALSAGARAAIITASGICSGVLVWGALSALGVAAIVTASADAYAVLRLAGAAYLVFLGIQALLRARRLAAAKSTQDDSAAREAPGGFRHGLVTNLLNPKVGIFYSAVLPQFVSHRDPILLVSLLFAAVHALMGMGWYSFSALVLSRGRRVFTRPRARAALEATTGAVLIGLGLRVATERS